MTISYDGFPNIMNLKPKIYIADLRHTMGNLIANPCMPLGIGYMKAVMDRDLPEVDSEIFTYPGAFRQ